MFYRKKNIKNYYKKLKTKFKNNKYNKFFNYFERNWLGEKYPTQLWNFNDLLKDNNSKKSI